MTTVPLSTRVTLHCTLATLDTDKPQYCFSINPVYVTGTVKTNKTLLYNMYFLTLAHPVPID